MADVRRRSPFTATVITIELVLVFFLLSADWGLAQLWRLAARLGELLRPRRTSNAFLFDNLSSEYNISHYCYMNADSTARFLGAMLDLVDDFISEFRNQDDRDPAYPERRGDGRKIPGNPTNPASLPGCRQNVSCPGRSRPIQRLALEWIERKRLFRRLEPVRQAIYVADEIIEKTFPSRPLPVRRPAFIIHRPEGVR